MASTQTFYLNAPSLSQATTVFNDATLLIVSPDGYYSDNTYVRQQVSGVLGTATSVVCPQDCGVPLFGGEDVGVYDIIVDLGDVSDTGAIVIRFNPGSIPKGFQATHNSIIYNELSSESSGYLAGLANRPTYVGDVTDDCGISGTTTTFTKYRYINGAPAETSNTEIVYIEPGSLQLTALTPGECVMVIPKPSTSSDMLYLKVILPCLINDVFDIAIECPAPLAAVTPCSATPETEEDPSGNACKKTRTQTYYYASVSTSTIGDLAVHDIVFEDANGSVKVADFRGEGYYSFLNSLSVKRWFRLDANSVVIEMGTCP